MRDNYYSDDQDIRFVMTTPEEETRLFAAARGGDESAREFLIRNHLLFAAMHAQRLSRGRLPKDEVISAANFALMKAFTAFNHSAGFRFTTYLRPFIRGAISALWKSKFSCGTLDPSAGGQSLPDGCPVEQVVDESATVEELDLKSVGREALLAALEKLEDRCAEVIRLRYFEGLSFAAIGKKWGVTREAPRATHAKALAKLRWLLRHEGLEA